MSAGRTAVSLADLQRVADDGFLTSVHKMLLGADAPVGEVVPVLIGAPIEAFLHDPDGCSDDYSHPADWQYRTTRADIMALTAERAYGRLSEDLAPLVDVIVYGAPMPRDEGFDRDDRAVVARVVRECERAVRAELPGPTYVTRPGRVRVSDPEPRVRVMASAVVTRSATGNYSLDGVRITAERAAEILAHV